MWDRKTKWSWFEVNVLLQVGLGYSKVRVTAVAQQDQGHFCSTKVVVSIPSLAQWVKRSGMLQLQCRLQVRLGSDPRPGNSICCRVGKKRKKKCDIFYIVTMHASVMAVNILRICFALFRAHCIWAVYKSRRTETWACLLFSSGCNLS